MLHSEFDPLLVAVSILLASTATYAALTLVSRVAATRGRSRLAWVAVSACTMGIGIWSMHFVGILALAHEVPVAYDIPLLVLSVVIAIAASAVAFLMASRPRIGTGRVALASLGMGSAIAGMHYVGMAAMHMPARLEYDARLVALSVAIAIAASFVALLVTVRLRPAEGARHAFRRRGASALLLGAAIYGMHYTGMAAAHFVPAPEGVHRYDWHVVGAGALATTVTVSTFGILLLVLLGAMADRWIRARLAHARALQESEARLRAAEAEQRALIEAMRDVVIVFDADGRYVKIPPTAPELLYRPSQDLIGKRVHDVSPPETADAFLAAIRQALATRDAVRLEYSLPIAERGVWFSAVLSPMSTDQVVCVARNVTAAREQQEALIAARDEAEAASKAKSEFLAQMSHELRTPLNAVIGFANVLRKNRNDTMEHRELEYVERIRDNGRNLLAILDDILDIAKLEAGRVEIHPGPVDLAALLREVVALLGGDPDGDAVSFVLDAPALDAALVTDRARLRQVVVNLVGNAMKFTPAGTITLRILRCPGTGAPLAIEVADTGIGIPPERLEAVFQPFEQADNSTARRHGGTGLGLAIARKLCETLGFTLTATSEPGVGSTFRIGLRAAAGATTSLVA
jgi:PAS domain S-box-containing protein